MYCNVILRCPTVALQTFWQTIANVFNRLWEHWEHQNVGTFSSAFAAWNHLAPESLVTLHCINISACQSNIVKWCKIHVGYKPLKQRKLLPHAAYCLFWSRTASGIPLLLVNVTQNIEPDPNNYLHENGKRQETRCVVIIYPSIQELVAHSFKRYS